MGRGREDRSATTPTSDLLSPLHFGFRSRPAARATYVGPDGQVHTLLWPHHVQRHVLAMDGQHYLLADVAQILGLHDSTLRKLRRRPEVFRGSCYGRCGGIRIYLFTGGDIDRISSHLAERSAAGFGRRGRPRMWSPAEAKERERAQLRTNYYRRRADALAANGDVDRAKTYLDRREALLDSLHQQSMLRMQELMARRTIGDGRKLGPAPARRPRHRARRTTVRDRQSPTVTPTFEFFTSDSVKRTTPQ
jgi:hypothetical protein